MILSPAPLRRVLLAVSAAAMAYLVFRFLYPSIASEPTHALAQGLSYERFTNAHFYPGNATLDSHPQVSALPLPIHPGDFALWGATGRDQSGHIWFATSSYRHATLTARLYEYDPLRDKLESHGDVLEELSQVGLLRPGEQQPKIHTKIVQCGDGHLYFASMDEPRPGEVGQHPPRWGSHLWRLRLPERRWEHLAAFAEGVIGLTGGGGYVFGLAFPDHVLIRFDVQTGQLKKVTVGSVEGHISRNIFMDGHGHVYVPRLRYTRPNHADHTLVEFDSKLNEVAENLLRDYQRGSADQAHGIIAFQHLADGSIAFTTHPGRLFRVVPQTDGPASLIDLGWFHPSGSAYAPCLFTQTGERYLFGLAYRHWDGETAPAWICHDLRLGKSVATPFPLPALPQVAKGGEWLLYGCQTTDDLGNFYVVGAYPVPGGRRPVTLQVRLTP